MRKHVCLALFLFWASSSFAVLRLPAVIGSNMVLQQQSSVKLWGWCDPQEKIFITTSWNNRLDSAKGTRDGKWELRVPTIAAGGPYTILVKGNTETIRLDNVLLGEVWICSGQSNMEMCESWGLPDVRAELPTCATNNIHFFNIPRTTAAWPQEDCQTKWTAVDSNSLKHFSAVGYFFARRLQASLNVPVGIIEAAWGGTPAEVWVPTDTIHSDPMLQQSAEKLEAFDGWPYHSGYCYNGMIAPVVPYTIAGALWYQGEANQSIPETYSWLMTTLIRCWREAWNKELPFYYVQIAPFVYGGTSSERLREQQAKLMEVPGTGMVVISDLVNDTTNIHPKDKHDVGARLAGWALAETYHKTGLFYKSPSFGSMEVKGAKVLLTMRDAPEGLVIRGDRVRECFVAGEDKVFYPAEVKVEGERLQVSSPKVKIPVAVRYQFSAAGIGNIFSREGLPLAPFRTDNWEE